MTKVLFSDILGTLISTDYIKPIFDDKKILIDGFCGADEEYQNLGKKLNEFLSNGHDLVLITTLSHCDHRLILDALLVKINNIIDTHFHKQVRYFISGDGISPDFQASSPENFEKTEINGTHYITGQKGITATRIAEKENAVDIFLKQRNTTYDNILALGDTLDDACMLLRVIELGGNSSFINASLLEEVSFSKMIDIILESEFHQRICHIFKSNVEKMDYIRLQDLNFLSFPKNFYSTDKGCKNVLDIIQKIGSEHMLLEFIDISKCIEEKYQQFYQSGVVTQNIINLYKTALIHRKFRFYQCMSVAYDNVLVSNSRPRTCEAALDRIKEIESYPTFSDYYCKILKKNQ